MSAFSVHVERREEPGWVVKLGGALSVFEVATLRDALGQIDAHAGDRVVLDVTGLTFVCSEALGTLVELRRSLADRGAELRLAGATSAVSDVLKKTRLAELFPMFTSAEQAFDEPA